ncbi:MAG: FadD3 family acyl-CoA ligase [Gammaproteobacteria bacterium]|nr:FadD3 family acyl-CoA ligase [Gammaproteobacteria bacterium]
MNTVAQAFAASVQQRGGQTAVITENGESISYSELDAARLGAARSLIAFGIRAGDRVAIWAPNSLEWIVAGLAIHSVGAVLVPLNTRMRGAEAAYVLQKSQARLLFTVGRFLDQHYPSLLAPHRPPTLRHIVVLSGAETGDTLWSDFLTRGSDTEAAQVQARSEAVRGDSVMDILFTSGTTGRPKGAVTTHAQNLRVISEWSKKVQLVPEDRYLVVNPFFHSFGYKVGWLGGLLAGCTVLPQAVFDARQILRRIAEERISVLPGPPTLFIGLLDDLERSSADLSSLRATITGAAAIAPALIERIRADLGFKVVLTGYGLTETCGIVSLCEADDDAQTIASTCGRAIPGIEVACFDGDNRPVATGEAGEVVVRGYNVMQAYLDDEPATCEAVDAQGWFHTGDIGVLDERGYLRITDRLKDMYISGGFNCYPAEIERGMAAHPAIAQVAVIGVPDARLGEVGKAYVVPRPGQKIEAESLIRWCREHMANYKVPRQIECLPVLPTNASGKVMKYQLRAAVADALQ